MNSQGIDTDNEERSQDSETKSKDLLEVYSIGLSDIDERAAESGDLAYGVLILRQQRESAKSHFHLKNKIIILLFSAKLRA